jgi:hypothetical protein
MQLDLYTQIILSVLSVYQSANKSICNNDTRWKLKKKKVLPCFRTATGTKFCALPERFLRPSP